MKILIINESPRKEGNTDQIIRNLIKFFEKRKIMPDELILRDIEMKLPDGCTECANSKPCPNIIDEFSKNIMPKIPSYDSIILCTPVHDDNVTALAKIFADRIVSFCHKKRMYLKNKKVGLIVHGTAGPKSWKIPIEWIKGFCGFHRARFIGYYACHSDSKPNKIKIKMRKLEEFVRNVVA